MEGVTENPFLKWTPLPKPVPKGPVITMALVGKKGSDAFSHLSRGRSGSLFKFKKAAKKVIVLEAERKFLLKDKLLWGPPENHNDAISGHIVAAKKTAQVSFPHIPLSQPLVLPDDREIFYTHDVKADKGLCVQCFDSLLVYLGGSRKLEAKLKRAALSEELRQEAEARGDHSSIHAERARQREQLAAEARGDKQEEPAVNSEERSETPPPPTPILSAEACNTEAELRAYVRSKIHISAEHKDQSCPLFITWTKHGLTESDVFMRGKSGSMAPSPLSVCLTTFTIEAAAIENQLGFFPIADREVRRLSVTIEIPNHYEMVYNVGDWVPGVHGICIRFEDSVGNKFSGMLMPLDTLHVGDDMEIIKMLMSNAGYRGAVTTAMVKKAAMMRFQTTLTSLSYDDYKTTARDRVKKKEERVLREQIRAQRALMDEETREQERRDVEERKAKKSAERAQKKKLKNRALSSSKLGPLEEGKEGDEEGKSTVANKASAAAAAGFGLLKKLPSSAPSGISSGMSMFRVKSALEVVSKESAAAVPPPGEEPPAAAVPAVT
jgi:hypothetical protein